MAITIDIAANTRDFQAGVKDVDKALDDVADALDDLTRETTRSADKAGDAISDAFKDAERDAERSTERIERALKTDIEDGTDDAKDEVEKLERSFRELADTARKETRDAGESGSENFRRFGETTTEVGDELKQNLGETFSSFRGDLEDLPQIAQDTLGGLAGSGALGGIAGVAATAAGAAGIGLLIGALETANEEAEEARRRAGEWADAYIEAGGRVLTFDQEASRVKSFYTDPDKIKEAEDAAKAWGVSFDVAAKTLSGNSTSIGYVSEKIEELEEKLAKTPQTDLSGGLSAEWLLVKNALDAAHEKFDPIQEDMRRGAELASGYSGYLRELAESTAGATRKVDEFGDTVVTLPDGKQIYIDAETGQATEDVDAIEKRIYGIHDHTVNVGVNFPWGDVDAFRAHVQRTMTADVQLTRNGTKVY